MTMCHSPVPDKIRPLMETLPVKGHFLSMYVPAQPHDVSTGNPASWGAKRDHDYPSNCLNHCGC